MTLVYLHKFFRTHPISHAAPVAAFLFFVLFAALLTWLAINGLYVQQAIDLINENRAPKTFELLCTIALIVLSLRVAIRGPIRDLSTPFIRVFGVYIPNAALGIGAVYVGIAWGVAIAATASGQVLPPPLTYADLFLTSLKLLIGLGLFYVFFILITVNEHVAPGYQAPSFPSNFRTLAGVFCLFLVGRSALLLLILFGSKS